MAPPKIGTIEIERSHMGKLIYDIYDADFSIQQLKRRKMLLNLWAKGEISEISLEECEKMPVEEIGFEILLPSKLKNQLNRRDFLIKFPPPAKIPKDEWEWNYDSIIHFYGYYRVINCEVILNCINLEERRFQIDFKTGLSSSGLDDMGYLMKGSFEVKYRESIRSWYIPDLRHRILH